MGAFTLIEGDVVLRDSSGNAVGVVLDGAVYRLQTDAKVTSSVLPTGAATEATLATRATEATLAAIRDTAGVKKITDALPVGDNVIGRTKLTDGTNVVAVVVDGAVYRLRVETKDAAQLATERGIRNGRVVLAATTVVAVQATTYTEQSANAQRSIVSSSANDAAAGTGARTVRLTYYTATMTGPFTETITLNGTSAVNTVATNICFIEKIEVLTVGSGLTNAGTITLKAATGGGGADVWSIAVGDLITFGAWHHVPTGRTCNVSGMSGGIKGADTCLFTLRSEDPTNANSAEVQVSPGLRVPSSGQSSLTFGTPIVITGPARITAFVAPDSSSSRTYFASFDYHES